MANNPYVNKVVFGDETLIDLTGDSVSPGVLQEGYTAHRASGVPIVGTLAIQSPTYLGFVDGRYKIKLERGIYSGVMAIPGIKLEVPSSGTNTFYIDFPDNSAPASNDEWTRITFQVDSNGNSNITDDTIPASGVSF